MESADQLVAGNETLTPLFRLINWITRLEMPPKPEPLSIRPLVELSKETELIWGCDDPPEPSPGSYTSAIAVGKPVVSLPPMTRTVPLGSKVAPWSSCAASNDVVVAQEPSAGSYSSAEERKVLGVPSV